MPATQPDFLIRLKGRIIHLSHMEGLNNPAVKKRIFYIAAVFFFCGLIASLWAQPDILRDISPLPMVFIIGGIFCTLALSSVELSLTAKLCGGKMNSLQAFETIIIGNAANMLPLPGNVLVKISRMRSLGIQYKHSVATTVGMAVAGLGLVMIYAGLWLLAIGPQILGWLGIAGGSAALLAALYSIYLAFPDIPTILKLTAIRLTLIIFHAGRIYLCILALGIAGSFAQASVMTVSGVLSSVVAVVPAGLGLQELLSAGIGPIIGLSAAAGFLISSLNRILGTCTVFIASYVLAMKNKQT